MVLQSNPRKRRAMAKGEGLGMGNKAGTGRSLYRPYNLNFVKDLGACCKQNTAAAAAAAAKAKAIADKAAADKADADNNAGQ